MSDDNYPNAKVAENITIDEGIRINGEELPYLVTEDIHVESILPDLHRVTVTFFTDSVTIGDLPEHANVTRSLGYEARRSDFTAEQLAEIEGPRPEGDDAPGVTPIFTRMQWALITEAAQ